MLSASAAAAVLVLILVARTLGGAGPGSGPQAGGMGPSAPDSRAENGLASVELGTTRECVAAVGTTETVSATAPEADAVSTKASTAIEELEKKREGLRVAMESALLGMIDPGAFLDAALLLTELEVASKPGIPEPDGAGWMHYPVLGTPDGMQAELCIARTGNQKFANPVLGLKLQLT